MIGISSEPLLAKNLNILHTFGEYSTKLENIEVYQSSLGEQLSIRSTVFGSLQIFLPMHRFPARSTDVHEDCLYSGTMSS
jgi:hypothetical protein